MRRDLSAVTVQATGHRVDLTLPNTVPLVEITPMVAALCGIDGDDARPPVWTLARVGQRPLTPTATLGDAGVLDGETLHLVDVSAWDSPHVVAFEEASVAANGEAERPAAAVLAVAIPALAVALLAVGAVTVAVTPQLRTAAGPALLAAAAAAIGAGYVLPASIGRTPRVALVLGSWPVALAAGWSLLAGGHGTAPLGAALTLLVAVLTAGPLMPELVTGAALFAAVLSAGAAAVAAGARPAPCAAVALVAATVAVRLGPGMVGGRLSRRAAASPAKVVPFTSASRDFLVSSTWGCAGVAVVAGLVLAGRGDGFGVGLVGVAGGSLLLRAMTFRHAREALPVAVGGAVVMVTAAVAATHAAAAHGFGGAAVLTLLAVGALVGVIPSLVRGDRIRTAPWWALVDAATLPLLLAALGLFQALASAMAGVLG